MVGTKINDGSSRKLMFGGALSLLQSFKARSKWVPWIHGDIVRHGFTILLEMSFNAVDTSIVIESHKMWSVPVCLKAVSSVICAAGVIMRTYTMTCHADCIRLLVGRDMNICHKVWSLRTVIPIQCTTNTSCCSLETQVKSIIWWWPCPLDYYFWSSDTTLARSPILQQE